MIDRWIEGIEIAIEAMEGGIYPMAVEGGPNPYKKRTEYMEGWNASQINGMEQAHNLIDAVRKDPGAWEYGLRLVLSGIGILDFKEDPSILLNMNDTFAYACGDAEETKPEDWPRICALHDKYGHHGVTAWAAHRRGYDPIQPCITDAYRAAMNELARPTETE